MVDESAEPPTVPVICSDCETETEMAIDDVADAVESHNERLHDGEQVAQVDPQIAEQVADLVAQDMGLLDDADEE